MPVAEMIEAPPRATTIGGVLRELMRHPVRHLIARWNWKAAVLSALVRGSLFFVTNLTAGLAAAARAMGVEAAVYIVIAGCYGVLLEAFRKAQPAWLAMLMMMLALLAINHSIELVIHSSTGTEELGRSVLASAALSMVSAAFNLFAMRRGALIVGQERQSLFADVRQLPRIVFDFLTLLPRTLWRAVTKR